MSKSLASTCLIAFFCRYTPKHNITMFTESQCTCVENGSFGSVDLIWISLFPSIRNHSTLKSFVCCQYVASSLVWLRLANPCLSRTFKQSSLATGPKLLTSVFTISGPLVGSTRVNVCSWIVLFRLIRSSSNSLTKINKIFCLALGLTQGENRKEKSQFFLFEPGPWENTKERTKLSQVHQIIATCVKYEELIFHPQRR